MSISANQISENASQSQSDFEVSVCNLVLDSFGQVFGIELDKMLFCYDKYANVEDMIADTTWPVYADFRSRNGLNKDLNFMILLKIHSCSLKPFNISGNIKEKIADAIKLLMENLNLSLDDTIRQLSLTGITEFNQNGSDFIFIKSIENLFPVCPLTYAQSMIKFKKLQNDGTIVNIMDYLKIYNKVDFKSFSCIAATSL